MRTLLCVMVGLSFTAIAYADLQDVQVGGQLEFRFRWYHDAFETGTPGGAAKPVPHLRIPQSLMPGRVMGTDPRNNLPDSGAWSMFRYSHEGNDWQWVEQAISLNIKADLTNNVSAFVEFYQFANWGETFRSNYLTGVDSAPLASDRVNLLQGYLQMDKVLGQNLSLRIGRQILQFGKDLSSFLLASKSNPTNRFSYDGIRATYKPIDKLTIDAWWMKLKDVSPAEEDGDTDFYGIYSTYAHSDAANLSLYWLYLRDASATNDTNYGFWGEWFEHQFGKDEYPTTAFHTVGFQFTGKQSGFDYNLQVAYQFGDAGKLGQFFQKPWWYHSYGDDSAEYDNWGMEAQVGYTFADVTWKPRPYLAANWFSGQDNRDVSFADWLNPLSPPKASVSFNRLFGDINYCPVINDNADMSNFWQVGGGVVVNPTDKFAVTVRAYNTFADKTFDWPLYVNVPRSAAYPTGRMPIAPWASFLTKDSSNNLGFSMDTILRYAYSKDLTILLYYGHLFTGDGLRDGAYVSYYGTMMNGGLDKKDADYMFLWFIMKF